MTHSDIETLANDLLVQYGLDLKGWRFAWNNRKRHFGLCSYKYKCIYVSRFMFDNTLTHTKFDDTVRHEIAHALSWVHDNYKGHGYIWKRWARAVGAVPRSRGSHDVVDEMKGVKYVTVDTSNNDKIIKKYYRRPSYDRVKFLHSQRAWIVGRLESKGMLKVKQVHDGVIGRAVHVI